MKAEFCCHVRDVVGLQGQAAQVLQLGQRCQVGYRVVVQTQVGNELQGLEWPQVFDDVVVEMNTTENSQTERDSH